MADFARKVTVEVELKKSGSLGLDAEAEKARQAEKAVDSLKAKAGQPAPSPRMTKMAAEATEQEKQATLKPGQVPPSPMAPTEREQPERVEPAKPAPSRPREAEPISTHVERSPTPRPVEAPESKGFAPPMTRTVSVTPLSKAEQDSRKAALDSARLDAVAREELRREREKAMQEERMAAAKERIIAADPSLRPKGGGLFSPEMTRSRERMGRVTGLAMGAIGMAGAMGGGASEAMNTVGGVVGGAASGAAIGMSLTPGLPVVGAAIGGVIGTVTGVISAAADAAERFRRAMGEAADAMLRTETLGRRLREGETPGLGEFSRLSDETRYRTLSAPMPERRTVLGAERERLTGVHRDESRWDVFRWEADRRRVGAERTETMSILDAAGRHGIEGVTHPESRATPGFGDSLSARDSLLMAAAERTPEVRVPGVEEILSDFLRRFDGMAALYADAVAAGRPAPTT